MYRLRPTLPRRVTLEDALLELGIRVAAYRDEPNLVLVRPQSVKPAAGQRWASGGDWETCLAPGEADRLFAANAEPVSLFFHEPQKVRLASFDAKSPFGAANTHTWLVSEMSPSGERNRRRFAHALAALDAAQMFDGGWLLPLGQEDALREVLSVYRKLPAQRFNTVPGEFQPVTVRTLAHEGYTYIYLVNDSPWEVGTSVNLDLPADCVLERLGECRTGTLTRNVGGAQWRMALRPYDLVAARFANPRVAVRQVQVTTPEQVPLALQRRIRDLGARVRALGAPQPLAVLENPAFELPPGDSGSIPGWTALAPMGTTISLDTAHKASGRQSLKLTSSGQPVQIVSGNFAPPTTGRLAVEVRLRHEPARPQPSLRIFVQCDGHDAKFERYGVTPSIAPNAAAPDEWASYTFRLDYLPAEGLENVRVGLELIEPGELWIDDVQVFDLVFAESERYELSKLISLASVVLEKRQLADCSQLLDGFWPQFLVSNVPLAQAGTSVARSPGGRAAQPNPAPVKKSTVLENLKDYLPRLPRR
jgi:hypothetical protein